MPPASPQPRGEQTDVPESADWYNSGFIWCGARTCPRHTTGGALELPKVRYNRRQVCRYLPDYSEASKFADLWISVKQGTDAALAMAMGHVVLTEYHRDRQVPYFQDYVRRYTDMRRC